MLKSGLSLDDTDDPEERKINQEIADWDEKLREFFERRIRDERELSNYIEKRSAWFELLRAHIRQFPQRNSETARNVAREKVLVERAERIYEDDFLSFFDDPYDAGVGTSDCSHSTDQSESDEGRQKLPKRNRTFNGVGEHRKGGSVRRHTTEPKMSEGRCCAEEQDSAVEDEEIRKLPVSFY
ncbi:unnamed protein product [Gongylonema pulchrum]|uniref:DUF2052 domain-containing protein n=1 Tax=Gongylonema pulchrum TaxID=637853 RepID=A0A183D0G4_9BILA|nr:unnamed protein product [Gongylonema pulchrum]